MSMVACRSARCGTGRARSHCQIVRRGQAVPCGSRASAALPISPVQDARYMTCSAISSAERLVGRAPEMRRAGSPASPVHLWPTEGALSLGYAAGLHMAHPTLSVQLQATGREQ